MHADFTPVEHVAAAAQAVHGSLPVAGLYVVPALHSGGGGLHTVSVVGVHAVFTPYWQPPAQVEHGALPVAVLYVEPDEHEAAWHTVFVVGVHAVFTPCAHVEQAL